MDFKNEKSKVYILGDNILSSTLLALTIYYFINRSNRMLSNKIFIIQQISFALLLILRGTKKIFARNDKKGYFDCIFGGIILLIYIVGSLIKYY